MNTLRCVALVASLVLCQGWARAELPYAPDPRDPLEGVNRVVFVFNEQLDRVVTRPLAKVYVAFTPHLVQVGVGHFFGNLADVWTAVNAALQWKGRMAGESVIRVAINSTIGLAGVLDVASELNVPKHREDFGQTLGHWGVGAGPYLMLPVLGPSSVRDGLGAVLDWQASGVQFLAEGHTRTALTVLRLTDQRARLLPVEAAMRGASLDTYSFVRQVWFQKRLQEIHDGLVPRNPADDPDEDAP